MKRVLAVNGSPRAAGNTAAMIETIFSVLSEREDTACEMIHIGGKPFRGCTGCGSCVRNQDRKCIFDDDPVNGCIAKMIEADAIILASPTYFSTLTPELKALIDRAGRVTRGNGNLLKRKVGAAVSPARRAGSLNTLQTIQNFFFITEMIVPGSSYWNMAQVRNIGDLEQDAEGIATMKNLAENISWLMDRT